MTRFLILLSIYWQSAMHGVDPRIVTAMVYVESSFRSNAVNRGCIGLMQVSLATWKLKLQLDESRMTEVMYNLDKGLDILQIYYRQTGDIWKALHFYNNGPSGKYNNTNYVRKVKRVYKLIQGRASCHTW
jgi:soluble lytic murein transglycosylase-like protein